MSSPEYVAYRQCIPEIDSTVANNVGLEWFATELLEAAIIADTVADKMGVLGVDNLQKANVLTSAISSQLQSDPDSFLTVITIMKKEPAFAHVLEELSKAYEGDSKAIKAALKTTSSGESDRQALKDLPLTLPNVLHELNEVTDSHQLGLNLGVPLPELTAIEQNYPRDAVRQKTETLSYWLDNEEDPSWEKIASAVEKRHRSLARKIRGEKQTSEEVIAILEKQNEFLKAEVEELRNVTTTEYLRGVEGTSFLITGRRQTHVWVGHGLRLHVPEGALPPGHAGCKVHMRAGLSGKFYFPEGSHPVSGMYWVSCKEKFLLPVTLELQHCAVLHDASQCSRLRFVVAKCSQPELPYKFKSLDHGVFTPNSFYGSISLSQFSIVAITEQLS